MRTDQRRSTWLLLVGTVGLLLVWNLYLTHRNDSDQWRTLAMKADSISAKDTVYIFSDTARRSFPRSRTKRRPLELNSADSLALLNVYGIGPVFAHRILDYRKRLGGYVNIKQLQEVKGIDNDKFEQISTAFYLDTIKITKININFASQNQLTAHPYIRPSMARRMDKYRKSKGGFTNFNELIDKDILLPIEAKRLAPYLSFQTN